MLCVMEIMGSFMFLTRVLNFPVPAARFPYRNNEDRMSASETCEIAPVAFSCCTFRRIVQTLPYGRHEVT